MNRRLLGLVLSALGVIPAFAAIPPAAQLFPQDTVGLISVPDWPKASAALKESNGGRLWADPAMETFRRKFEERFHETVVADLEKQLGIKLVDYTALAQGQITLALQRSDGSVPDRRFEWVLLLDAGNKSAELQKLLADARGKLGAANKTARSFKIRDVEFTTVAIEGAELEKLTRLAPAPAPNPKQGQAEAAKVPTKLELSFGQVDSALLIGSSAKGLEKVVTRLTGGLVPPLGELETYGTHEALFRGAQAVAWLDFSAFLQPVSEAAAGMMGGLASVGVDPRRATTALGLEGLQSVGFSAAQNTDGSLFQLVLRVPEARRTGLFKLLQLEAKESGVPPFIPGDAVKFSRWRLSGPKMWQAIEEMLGRIAPQLVGVLQLALETAGQAQGQKLNLRKTLLETLGDDFMTWEKAAKGSTDADLAIVPSISLIGSANGEALIASVQALMQLAPDGADALKTREFLGRKIYTLQLPSAEGADSSVSFAASGGYLALADQPSILEEYLRSGEGSGRLLRDFPGLTDAAQKVGGFGVGMFGFENRVETTRARWQAARRTGNADQSVPTVAAGLGLIDNLKTWADFTLLPPFEKVERHFGYSVETFGKDSQGFNLKLLVPPAGK